MSAFLENLKSLMEEHAFGQELVFNADQSDLYFKRFPCTTIIAKEQSNYVKETKSIQSKDRITEMVGTSSLWKKCPMYYVGESKQPKCFRNADDDDFNQIYISKNTAWFNLGVTQWWFQDVFATWFNESFRVDDNEE